MKATLIALAALFSSTIVFSQDITGLWTGTMSSDPSGQELPYEVYISKEKGKFSGYSRTCVLADGKECYGIRKLKINIAKDGKVVLLDDGLVEDNFTGVDKELKQLDVLDLIKNDAGATLNGLFTTRIKKYYETTGKIRLKKVNTTTESTLMTFLKKINGENDISVVK